MTTLPRAVTVATLLLACSCSSEREPEFADWLFPIPEGTPIKEYGAVPLEGRDGQKIQLIEDLVIGDDPSGSAPVLYEPSGIVASEEGNIFIGDRGADDIKMFDADGTYLKTLGNEGQGPGEFGRIGSMALAGDYLVVNDSRNRRFSVWALNGDHVTEHTPTERVSLSSIRGLADGTTVSYFTDRDENGVGRRVVVRRTLEGQEINRIFETPSYPSVFLDDSNTTTLIQSLIDSLDDPIVGIDAGTRENLYISPLRRYQILAMSPKGEARWALRVAWEQLPMPETQKQPFIDSFLQTFPSDEPPAVKALDWPERIPALASISTDGAGRIYAFIRITALGADPPEAHPVDVYSPDGEFIAAGVLPNQWSYALGDYVYGIRANELEESEVVRYRIVINEN